MVVRKCQSAWQGMSGDPRLAMMRPKPQAGLLRRTVSDLQQSNTQLQDENLMLRKLVADLQADNAALRREAADHGSAGRPATVLPTLSRSPPAAQTVEGEKEGSVFGTLPKKGWSPPAESPDMPDPRLAELLPRLPMQELVVNAQKQPAQALGKRRDSLRSAIAAANTDLDSPVRHCLFPVFPLPSWLRHCLCLVFPLPSWLKYCLFLADFQGLAAAAATATAAVASPVAAGGAALEGKLRLQVRTSSGDFAAYLKASPRGCSPVAPPLEPVLLHKPAADDGDGNCVVHESPRPAAAAEQQRPSTAGWAAVAEMAAAPTQAPRQRRRRKHVEAAEQKKTKQLAVEVPAAAAEHSQLGGVGREELSPLKKARRQVPRHL